MSITAIASLPTITDKEEGFRRLEKLEVECDQMVSEEIKRRIRFIRLRWEQGKAAMDLKKLGVSVEESAQKGHCSKRTLYNAIAFVKRCPTMPDVNIRIAQWEEEGRNITWAMVRSWAAKALPPSPEKAQRSIASQKARLEDRVARLGRDLKDVIEAARMWSSEDAEEVIGIVSHATAVSNDVLSALDGIGLEALQRSVSARYLSYIREKGCCNCGASAPSQAHHVDRGGTGTKGSDYYTIPLCHNCHSNLHQHGDDAVFGSFDIWQVVSKNLANFIEGTDGLGQAI